MDHVIPYVVYLQKPQNTLLKIMLFLGLNFAEGAIFRLTTDTLLYTKHQKKNSTETFELPFLHPKTPKTSQ